MYDHTSTKIIYQTNRITDKQRIEYAEIRKTIKKKAKVDIRKYNQDSIRETIMASTNLDKARRTHTLNHDRLITLLNKQGREIHDQDKIIERKRGILHLATLQ